MTTTTSSAKLDITLVGEQMVVLLLGLIAAIMLFGAAKVRSGIVGGLGAAVLVAAIVLASRVPTGVWMFLGFGLLLAFLIAMLFFHHLDTKQMCVVYRQRLEAEKRTEEQIQNALKIYKRSGEGAMERYISSLPAKAAISQAQTPAELPPKRLLQGGRVT